MRLAPHRLLVLASCLLLADAALARGARGSEAERLVPGSVGYLTWVPYTDVASEAARTRRPVLLYLYESVKNQRNVQEMIAAQRRLFSDADVQLAAASLICTKADRLRPQDALLQGRRLQPGFLNPDGEGGGEEEGAPDPPDEKGEAQDPELILDPANWPAEICLYFLDYRGRPITRISEITSKRSQFVATVEKVLATNEKRIKADDREAELEARRQAREALKAGPEGEGEEPEQDPEAPAEESPDEER